MSKGFGTTHSESPSSHHGKQFSPEVRERAVRMVQEHRAEYRSLWAMIKQWTARRKAALVLEIIQGKTAVAEASRQFDLTPSEIDSWLEDGKRGMGIFQLKSWQVRKRAAPSPHQALGHGDIR